MSVYSSLALFFFLSVSVSSVLSQQAAKNTVAKSTIGRMASHERISFYVVKQSIDYGDLIEYFYSPAHDPWIRKWKEDNHYASLRYDLLRHNNLILTPAVHLGFSQAEFSAANRDTGFYEWWQNEAAPIWGVGLKLEIHRDKEYGVFLRFEYDYYASGADERKEIIEPTAGRGSNPDARMARFDWWREEFLALLGWRRNPLAPMLGVSYHYFQLNKKLDFNIVDDAGDPQLISALNEYGARYKYTNRNKWSLVGALEWTVREKFKFNGILRLGGDRDVRVEVGYEF